MNRRGNWLLAFWIAFIFGTSCTVIRPNEFFSLVNTYIIQDPAKLEQFQILWAAIWLFVVKGWHFAEFAILQVLATRAVDWIRGTRSQTNVLLAALGCVLFAASDEWHQSFVPDRYGTVWDVFVDSLGVMTTALFLTRARKATPTSPNNAMNTELSEGS